MVCVMDTLMYYPNGFIRTKGTTTTRGYARDAGPHWQG